MDTTHMQKNIEIWFSGLVIWDLPTYMAVFRAPPIKYFA